MKLKKNAILGYKPEPPPVELPASAQRYLDDELNRIANFLLALQAKLVAVKSPMAFELLPTMEQPVNPIAPEIIYVDGTAWDPGSGQGYYYYNGMVWTPLG